MKVAVLGDIHGNMEALQAAYAAARAAGAEKMYHLGDLGGYAPFVNDVVAFLTEQGIDGAQGNYDEAVANDQEHCGCKAEEPLQEEMAHRSFAWTKTHVSPASKAYLKGLPGELTITVEGKKVRLFHATPKKNNLYWYEDRPEQFFREMAGKIDADVLIYGHTHKPYWKEFEGKIFINAGSVGKPKDGDPRACVALIEITDRKVSVEFLRVAYDVEKTAQAIVANGLPVYFAERLKEGK